MNAIRKGDSDNQVCSIIAIESLSNADHVNHKTSQSQKPNYQPEEKLDLIIEKIKQRNLTIPASTEKVMNMEEYERKTVT